MSQNKAFNDAFKAFSSVQPQADFKEVFNAGRKNVEAFTAANQAFAEGVQAVFRRQAEVAQKQAEDALNLFKEVASSKNPEASIAKQAEFAKSAFETSLANTREAIETASKAGTEASEIIGKRAVANVEEYSVKAAEVAKKATAA
jgi:phasin family protein